MHVLHTIGLKKMVLWVVPVEPAFQINPFYLFIKNIFSHRATKKQKKKKKKKKTQPGGDMF